MHRIVRRAARGRPGPLVALGAALALLASGCAANDGPAEQAGAGPRPGGTLSFATDVEPACIDPAVSPLDVTALIDRNIFDSLVNLTPDGAIHPWLARSWDVSPDGLGYTFRLRTGVRFHDGGELDAAAVKTSLDHVVDPKTKSQGAAGLMAAYKGSEVVDPTTIRITLSRPYAPFLQVLSTAYLGIQSPRSLTGNAAGVCARPVGSGPFRFEKWTKKQSISLRRNPEYAWAPPTAGHDGPAHLDGLSIRFITENAVRVGALTSGQVDVIGSLPAANVRTVKRDGSLQLLRADAPGGVYSIFLNAKRGPFADERVRIAFQRSVDVDGLIKAIYFGQYHRAWGPLSPNGVGYDPAVEGSWPRDRALADRLLDEAGWTGRDSDGVRTRNGQRLSLRWPVLTAKVRESRDILGEGIQAQARQVGIDVDRVGQDTGSYSKDVYAGNMDIWDTSNVRAEPDVLRTLFGSGQTLAKGGLNVFKLADPQIDGWLDRAAAAGDPAVRADNYRQLQEFLVKHALTVPMYVPTYLIGADKKVHGVTFEAAAFPLFYDAWLGK
ncbi:ABC transporter substrate-binding protein [Embleya sp. AB8]|uniref:ABC transporter substrate-binding protein n=1 Tax=Embleya sp. AB8 TaxID=3156304 RepID=UPI003C78C633